MYLMYLGTVLRADRRAVVTTLGKYGDYTNEIQQSYEPGFTPYRLHTNVDGTFVTPVRREGICIGR